MTTEAIDRLNGPEVLLATSLAALGALSVASRDFAYQWQPVPDSLAHRPALAVAFGFALALCAMTMLLVRSSKAALALVAVVTFWVVAMQLPRLFAAPTDFTRWLGVAEISAIATGTWTILLKRQANPGGATGPIKGQMVVFGVMLVIFGMSHFLFARFTAMMVPGFLPFHFLLAYLTGAVHSGTGLMLLAGWRTRIAAAVEAAMMASFAILVHLPRVARTPTSRLEWTMLIVALALTASAWIVSRSSTAVQPKRS